MTANAARPREYLRLRQICLVAADLDRAIRDIEDVLGVRLCYRDPAVAKYGLVNALFPIGTDFLEVVVPTREGTTAGRFLQASGGRGGYMAIFDCHDPERRRAHAEALGIRIAHTLDYHGFYGNQLHPKDCRAAMLEFDRTEGGDDLRGPYHPAGPDWQRAIRTDVTRAMRGIEVASPDAAGLARHWARIIDRPLAADGRRLEMDNTEIAFVEAPAGARESLAAIRLDVADASPMLAAARKAGLATTERGFDLCGVTFVVREETR